MLSPWGIGVPPPSTPRPPPPRPPPSPRGGGRATPRICRVEPADLVLTSLHTAAPTLKAPEVVGGRSTDWVRRLWGGGMQ